MLREVFDTLLTELTDACCAHYGERLLALAVFGSVARGTMRADSDIDFLLVVSTLPQGRMARVDEFSPVEATLSKVLRRAEASGVHTTLSPVFKTPQELEQGSLLFLDMTDQARILFERQETLSNYLGRLRARLAAMGAKRVQKGGGYYWILKPDLKPGEEITL